MESFGIHQDADERLVRMPISKFAHRSITMALQMNILLAFGIMLLAGTSLHAQMGPGSFADNNHPSGPPDPEKEDQIWQVDPITGALSVRIPFTSTPQGGRGPKLPFALIYNSSSTIALQAGNVTVENDGSMNISCQDIQQNAEACEMTSSGALEVPSNPTILETLQWVAGSNIIPHGPTGPWTTTGPFFLPETETVATQTWNLAGTTQNLGAGCTIEGPYLYSDESGATHDLNLEFIANYPLGTSPNGFSSPCSQAINYMNQYGYTSASTDGSALQTTDSSVVYPDGTTAYMGSNELEDSNGNIASIVADSLGRTPYSTNLPIGQGGQFPVGTYTVTTSSASGTPQPYTITVGSVPLSQFSMAHPVGDPGSEVSNSGYCAVTCPNEHNVEQIAADSTTNVVTLIELPNNTFYTFTYDPNYGTLSKLAFPTGGYVRFRWGMRSDGGGYGAYSRLSTLVVTDVYLSTGSGAELHWQYCFPSYSNASASTPTNCWNSNNAVSGLESMITAPDNSYSIYQDAQSFIYSVIFQNGAAPNWKPGVVSYYGSSGTLLKTVATNYEASYQSAANGLPLQVTTTLYGGTTPMQQEIQLTYDTFANVTAKYESDYYPCSAPPCTPPGWIRETFINYLWSVPSGGQPTFSESYTAAHIVDRPSQVLVTDGNNHPFALTAYIYDEGTLGGSAGYTGHDDTHYGLSSNPQLPRGNVTTEKRCTAWTSTTVTPSNAASNCSSWLSTTHTYDLAGQILSTKDPNGNITSFSYTDNYQSHTTRTQTDGYITSVTYPLNYTDTFSYYYASGQIASHSDWSQNVTGYTYEADLGRLASTSHPDGGSITNCYTDTTATPCYVGAIPPSVQTETTTNEPAGAIVNISQYDGLGRVIETELQSDPYNPDYVMTTYDANGRVYSVSNPIQSSSAPSAPSNQTTYFSSYDGLSRLLTKTNPDGSVESFSYAGNTATFTDENGNQWSRTTNGIGQLTAVLEPSGTSQSPSMETDYAYAPTGDLLSVAQWGGPNQAPTHSPYITHSFAYNGVSWLIGANNPETVSAKYPAAQTCSGTPTGSMWATCYGYDGNGNLASKVDNRGYAVSYSYDQVNRLVSKTYPMDSSATTFASCYQYASAGSSSGTSGRLVKEWTQEGSCSSPPPANPSPASGGYVTMRTIAAYDPMGRVWNETQCTTQGCYGTTPCQTASGTQSYSYDYVGNVTCYGNGLPSTPGVSTTPVYFSQVFDAANHLSSITSSPTAAYPTNFYTLQSYGPLGPLNWNLGSSLSVSQGYTNRRWVNVITATGQIP